MKKLILFVFFLLLCSTSWAEVPKDIKGTLNVNYKISDSSRLPGIFYGYDRLFVQVDGSGKDILLFYKECELIQEVKVDEKSGASTFKSKFVMSNVKSGLDRIWFDWTDDSGIHEFRSTNLSWCHRDGFIPTMFYILLGNSVIYEVFLTENK
jgi:hypothetical protein